MMTEVFGTSALGMSISAYTFGTEGPRVLILGGVHGDEKEGVFAAASLLEHFKKNFDYRLQLTLIPAFNPDGVLKDQRLNGNDVDLNRNLPTKDWDAKAFNDRYPPGPFQNSETENQALVQWLEQKQPKFVISLHSFTKFMLNVNGDCSAEANVIHQRTGYPIEESIGYPTPGCLGTYCGLERGMPTLTYEIERGLSKEKILEVHIPAILEALKETEKRS